MTRKNRTPPVSARWPGGADSARVRFALGMRISGVGSTSAVHRQRRAQTGGVRRRVWAGGKPEGNRARRSRGRGLAPPSDGNPLLTRLLAGLGGLRRPAPIPLIERVGVWGPGAARLSLRPPQAPLAFVTTAVMAPTDLVKHSYYLSIDRPLSLYVTGPSRRRGPRHKTSPRLGHVFTISSAGRPCPACQRGGARSAHGMNHSACWPFWWPAAAPV